VRPLSAIHLHINSTDILKHYCVTLVGGHILVALNVTVQIIMVQVIL